MQSPLGHSSEHFATVWPPRHPKTRQGTPKHPETRPRPTPSGPKPCKGDTVAKISLPYRRMWGIIAHRSKNMQIQLAGASNLRHSGPAGNQRIPKFQKYEIWAGMLKPMRTYPAHTPHIPFWCHLGGIAPPGMLGAAKNTAKMCMFIKWLLFFCRFLLIV